MRHETPFSTGPTPPISPHLELRREHLRLRRVFTTLLFALAPAALAQACGLGSPPGATGAGGGVDAASEGAEGDAQPGSDADAAAPQDGSVGDSCVPVLSQADTGPDAKPLCFYMLPCGLSTGFSTVVRSYYKGTGDAAIAFGCSCWRGRGAPGACTPRGRRAARLCARVVRQRRRPQAAWARPPARPARAHRPRRVLCRHGPRRGGLRARLPAHARRGAAHGAPAALVRAAARSARDEEQHARLMARHAREHGAAVPRRGYAGVGPARSRRSPARTPSRGASTRPSDADHALASRACARRLGAAHVRAHRGGRTRHAALSWAVARWAERRLDAAARARIAAARFRALRSLGRGARGAAFDSPVGRPDQATHAALVAGMNPGARPGLRRAQGGPPLRWWSLHRAALCAPARLSP